MKNLKNLKKNLSVEIFHPRFIRNEQLARYNEVFKLWYAIWVETRVEVNPELPTPSDNFSRQDEIIAVFIDERPIATICLRYVDLRQACVIEDSFFTGGQWPEDALLKLPEIGNTFALTSHLFIDPDFRKTSSGLPTKNLVGALSFVQANATRPDVYLAMTRKDRGIHSLFLSCGGSLLVENVSFYHIPVDLMAAYPARTKIKIDPMIQPLIDELKMTCPTLGKSYFETLRDAVASEATNESNSQRSPHAARNQNPARRAS